MPEPEHQHIHGAFGSDSFGRRAERIARLFGTPQYIVGQTVAVAIWIVINAAAIKYRWDAYPFILLNLAFSTQAAYAAPLILLAQTRQAERDKLHGDAITAHRERTEDRELKLLEDNKALTESLGELTRQIEALAKKIEAKI